MLLHKIMQHHIKFCDLHQFVIRRATGWCIGLNFFKSFFYTVIIFGKFVCIAQVFAIGQR